MTCNITLCFINSVLSLCMITAIIALLVGRSRCFASLHLYWVWALLVHPIPKCHIPKFSNYGMLNKINNLIELYDFVEKFEIKETFEYLFKFSRSWFRNKLYVSGLIWLSNIKILIEETSYNPTCMYLFCVLPLDLSDIRNIFRAMLELFKRGNQMTFPIMVLIFWYVLFGS